MTTVSTMGVVLRVRRASGDTVVKTISMQIQPMEGLAASPAARNTKSLPSSRNERFLRRNRSNYSPNPNTVSTQNAELVSPDDWMPEFTSLRQSVIKINFTWVSPRMGSWW